MPSSSAPDNRQPGGILAIGGHDPSGGAGIQADIETAFALGVPMTTALTTLTVQTTKEVRRVAPVAAALLGQQLEAVLEEFAPNVIKIGLLPNPELIDVVAECLSHHRGLTVLDPVLAAGSGTTMTEAGVAQRIADTLLARMAVITPNHNEVLRLCPGQTQALAAATQLAERYGCQVLLTGTDATQGDTVEHQLIVHDGVERRWHWPRLAGEFHGSGCTLATAIAAYLALGRPVSTACELAQAFTYDSLKNAFRSGTQQQLPARNRTKSP